MFMFVVGEVESGKLNTGGFELRKRGGRVTCVLNSVFSEQQSTLTLDWAFLCSIIDLFNVFSLVQSMAGQSTGAGEQPGPGAGKLPQNAGREGEGNCGDKKSDAGAAD